LQKLAVDLVGAVREDAVTASFRKVLPGEADVELTFVAKDPDSNPGESATLYRTDSGSWVVQGPVVTDPDALAAMDIPEGETCVEIPDRLVPFFSQQPR
jgi:hypothetical protein